MKKKDLLPGQRYSLAYLKYLNIFIKTGINIKNSKYKSYYAPIRYVYIVAINNLSAFKLKPNENEIKLFIRTNQYCIAEYGRLSFELYQNKIINKKELYYLNDSLKGFKRECVFIQNIIIQKAGLKKSSFNY
ncbi:MAG: hypothetical protein WAV89_05150 [Ignavibacteriaceae bacterium]